MDLVTAILGAQWHHPKRRSDRRKKEYLTSSSLDVPKDKVDAFLNFLREAELELYHER